MKKIFKFLVVTSIFILFTGSSSVFALDCISGEDGEWEHAGTGEIYQTKADCEADAANQNAIEDAETGVNLDNTEASGNGNATAGSGVSVKLENPLGTIDSIPEFVKAMLNIVMKVGVPLVALAIIYTGYLFIAAQGKPEELKKAKDALVYVFIGSMILLGAYVIAESIIGTVNAIRGK